MASRTTSVNINGYWGDDTLLTTGSFADLAYGDTLTLGSGAILKINPAIQTPTGITVGVNIICIAGFAEIWWENDSTTTAWAYYGPETGTLRVESGCLWKVRGNKISIGTGDGTWGQVVTGYTSVGYTSADEPAVVFVGGVPYINIAHCTSLQVIGVGVLGNFFSYNTSTGAFTFGDNGKPTTLTSNAAAGQAVINVTSAENYVANDWIHLLDPTDDPIKEALEILSIATNAITCKTNLRYSYTTANGSYIRLTKGGNVAPNRADITVYNIGLGTKNSSGTKLVNATLVTNFELDTNSGGKISVQGLNCFGFYLKITAPSYSVIDGMGYSTQIDLTTTNDILFTHVYCSPSRNLSTEPSCIAQGLTSSNNVFESCIFARKSVANPVAVCRNMSLIDTNVFLIERASNPQIFSDVVIESITLKNCLFAGTYGVQELTSKIIAENIGFSVTMVGHSVSNSATLLYCKGSVESVIKNIYVIFEGSYGAITTYVFTLNGEVLSSSLTLLSNVGHILVGSNETSLKRLTVYPPVGSSYNIPAYDSLASYNRILIQNCKVIGRDPSPTIAVVGSGLTIKASAGSRDTVVNLGSATDSHFYEQKSTDEGSSGCIGLFMTEKNFNINSYTCSNIADVKFTNGRLFIVVNNGWIEFEWPHWIIGVTGYPSNGTINIAGVNTANFKIESSVNLGSGFSALETLYDAGTYYPTVLSSKTIVNARHKLKIRISKVTGNVTDYINRLNFQTNVDYDTYLYPLSEATLTLSGIVEGTEVRIFDSSDNELVGTESVGATGIFEYAYGYDADVVVRVEIISVAYKNKSFNVTLREYDQAVVVQQEPDNTYINPA